MMQAQLIIIHGIRVRWDKGPLQAIKKFMFIDDQLTNIFFNRAIIADMK